MAVEEAKSKVVTPENEEKRMNNIEVKYDDDKSMEWLEWSAHSAPLTPPDLESKTPVLESLETSSDDHYKEKKLPLHEQMMATQKMQDRAHLFWHHYDECVILCLGAQLGIMLRKWSNYLTSNLNLVFNEESALAPDLPVNCLALFFLGFLCSGEDVLVVVKYDKRSKRDERHEVAWQAFERRIRASTSLVLFPAKRE